MKLGKNHILRYNLATTLGFRITCSKNEDVFIAYTYVVISTHTLEVVVNALSSGDFGSESTVSLYH